MGGTPGEDLSHYGTSGPNLIDGGAGNDKLAGGDGDDVIRGNTGIDTAVYSGNLAGTSIRAIADADPFTPGSQVGWQVDGGNTDGLDTLTGVEKISDGAGHHFLLVGNGGYADIAAAITAASAGDTIIVAPGTWTFPTGIDKPLTFLGANAGVSANDADGDPNGDRGAETILDGGSGTANTRFNTTGPVTFDGFTITRQHFDSYTTGASITFDNNVITNPGSSVFYFQNFPSSVTLDDNRITGVTSSNGSFDAVSVSGNWNGTTGTQVDISGNVLTGSAGVSGFNLSSVHGTIASNTIDGLSYYGVLLANNTHVDVTDNTFANIVNPDPTVSPTWGAGVRTYAPGASFGLNLDGNTFTDNAVGLGIRLGSDLPSGSVTITDNTFDGNTDHIINQGTPASDLTLGGDNSFDSVKLSDATDDQLLALSDKIVDAVDNASYGSVVLNAGDVYFTADSFFEPGTTTPSLQRAINTAHDGDTVHIGPGDFSGPAGTATTAADDLTITAPSDATGISVTFGTGVHDITLQGESDINVTGNELGNVISGNDGDNLIRGLGGDDTLTGGAGDNLMNGGAGNDSLDGGDGMDTASYADAGSGVTVSLAAQGPQDTGGAGSDSLTHIENLTGSNFNDTLTGDAQDNTLKGQAGDDTLSGGAGDDTLDGGAGSDTASYADAASGVTVSLAEQGSAHDTGGAGSDTLSSIENLRGSAFADTLTGDVNDNVFTGGNGNDRIDGGDGTDTAVYSGTLTAANITAVADIDEATPGNQPGWQVNGGGANGTDLLTGVEKVSDGAGHNFLLVGSGGYDTIQEAIDAASPGDTIEIAAGTYDEHVVIDKAVTLLGANAGIGGNDDSRGPESVVTGGVKVQAGGPVTVDGVEISGSYDTFGTPDITSPSHIGLLIGSADVTIENSVLTGDDLDSRPFGTTSAATGLDFDHNVVHDWARAAYFTAGSDGSITHNIFHDNGGGVFSEGLSFEVSDNSFSGSTGADVGGYVTAATVNIASVAVISGVVRRLNSGKRTWANWPIWILSISWGRARAASTRSSN